MTLIDRLLERITGRDDLERIAVRSDPALLDRYLEQRRLFFPKRPRRFLDPASLTQDDLIQLIREEGEETAGDRIEFWVLEVAGKRRLPAFSSLRRGRRRFPPGCHRTSTGCSDWGAWKCSCPRR